MSTKVLVIPEDPKNNGYILKPVVERVFREAGRPNAQITMLRHPKLHGITSAKDAIRHDLPEIWRWMDLWVFLPDADRTNDVALAALEAEMRGQGITLIGCAAKPEVEALMLAGHRDRLRIPWSAVAGHPRFKEEVFDPFLEEHGYPDLPGNGREKLTRETLNNYDALKQLCPEIAQFEERVRVFLAGE